MVKRKYGLIKQTKDPRDYKLKQLLSVHGAVVLPTSVDLRKSCPAIYDQGELGSCTANAGVAARVMLDKIKVQLSRLFLYYQERVIEGDVSQDGGAQMRDIGKALSTYGVCPETDEPYNAAKFTVKPSATAVKDALAYKIKSYYSVPDTNGIKQVLALKAQPVLSGILVYESFESATVAKTGIIPMPAKKEKLLGGHAICIVGYDDSKSWFICRNSWGASWGDKGYFYLPYTYFNGKLASDFWVLQN